MIHTMILPCILDAHHITHVFHDTDRAAVTAAVRAYRANVIIRYHHACTAISDVVAKTVDRRCEMMDILLRLLQQMQGKTQCTPPSYARKGAYGINSLLQKL
jgi:hypothetical protein